MGVVVSLKICCLLERDVGGCGEGGEEMLFKIKIEKNNTTSRFTARHTNNAR